SSGKLKTCRHNSWGRLPTCLSWHWQVGNLPHGRNRFSCHTLSDGPEDEHPRCPGEVVMGPHRPLGWQRCWRSLFPERPPQRRARRVPLGVEALETRAMPAVLTVNSLLDTDPTAQSLTLRDALAVTDGSLSPTSLTAAQLAQISGTIGNNDTIQFGV